MSESLNNIGLTGSFTVGSVGWGGPMNNNIALIDALLQPRAINITDSVPGSPANSDLYIVGGSPTGDFAGKAKNLAVFVGEWVFISPKAGFQVYLISESVNYIFDGTNWVVLPNKGDPGEDAPTIDVLGTKLTGIESLSVTGNVIETDSILEAIAKIRSIITTLTAPPNYGDVHDIGGEGFYPYSQSDGTLYTSTQNIVIPVGFYRFLVCGSPVWSSNPESGHVFVKRTLTSNTVISSNGNGFMAGRTSRVETQNQMSPFYTGGLWTETDEPSSTILRYTFSTARQISQPAKGIAPYADGSGGDLALSNIIHFLEPTELTLTIPEPTYTAGSQDPTDMGTGFVWIREVEAE